MRCPRVVLALAVTAALAACVTPAAAAAPSIAPPSVGGAGLDAPLAVSPGAPPLPAVTAETFLVADLDTGDVLAAKGAHVPLAPASTLKVLTALTLMPRIPAGTVLTPTRANANVDGTKVGLVPGFGYPVAEVFQALEMSSANDAAEVLASWSGDRATTVRWMNDEARRLQADNTVAVTPSGLDAPGQQSTAYDLALIARAALALPQFAADAATRRSSVSAPDGTSYEIDNHNRLLSRYEGAIGVKGGYTNSARASFIAAADRGGRRILTTLMRTNDGPLSQRESEALLDWGFAAAAAGVAPVGALVEPLDVIAARKATGHPRAVPRGSDVTEASAPTLADGGGSMFSHTAQLGGLGLLAVLGLGTTLRMRVRRRSRHPRSRLRLPRT